MFWEALSRVLGWVYFLAWSTSFYPQVFLNRERQSVAGLSFEFLYLNLWGFLCYSIFNSAFYFSQDVRKQYRDQFGTENVVQLNDVFFGIHAIIITLYTIYQTWLYKLIPQPRVANWAKLYIGSTVLVSIALLVLTWIGAVKVLHLLYFLSYVKMGVTLIKYIPQAIMNAQRKSTAGWAIGTVLLDFIGGIFSMAQQFIDSLLQGDWTGLYGNPVKLGLAVLSIFFDVLFMIQHYVLYPESHIAEDAYVPVPP